MQNGEKMSKNRAKAKAIPQGKWPKMSKNRAKALAKAIPQAKW